MLPTVGAETQKGLSFGAEVGGRIQGIALMVNLVPDATKRAALEKSGNAIIAAVHELSTAYIARLVYEYIEHRIIVGKGRGIDRGFDGVVSASSETIRTSLPDRSTRNPEYIAIFPNGAEEYSSPTVKEDDELAADLRKSVESSGLTVKADVLSMLDAVISVVGAGAAAVRESEKKVNDLFQAELNGRKRLIDVLWEERKNVELILGRSGRGLARFIFFDFRKDGGEAASSDPKGMPQEEPVGAPPPVDGAKAQEPK